MPVLHLITNVKPADAKALTLELSKLAAETLGKPEALFQIIVTYNEALAFAGTFDPTFSLKIDTLDNLSAQLNEGYSKAFFTFFHEKLGIPETRGFIVFVDPGNENFGREGTTVAALSAKQ